MSSARVVDGESEEPRRRWRALWRRANYRGEAVCSYPPFVGAAPNQFHRRPRNGRGGTVFPRSASQRAHVITLGNDQQKES